MNISAECCGIIRRTPFCPQCGRQVSEAGAVFELLSHVSKTVASHKKCLVESKRHLDTNPHNREWHEKRVSRHQKSVEKWERWEAALKDLIETVKRIELVVPAETDK